MRDVELVLGLADPRLAAARAGAGARATAARPTFSCARSPGSAALLTEEVVVGLVALGEELQAEVEREA